MKIMDNSLRLRFSMYIIHVAFLFPYTINAQSIIYRYDVNQRLVGVGYDSAYSINYTYDVVGNRIKEIVANAQLQSADNNAITFDQEGKLELQKESEYINSFVNAGYRLDLIKENAVQYNTINNSNNSIKNSNPSESIPDVIVYEDAEDRNDDRWKVIAGPEEGVFVKNVFDSDRQNRVIDLNGDVEQNIFQLIKSDGAYWNDTNHRIIQWSMKTSDDFMVSVAVQTDEGPRYLSFTPEAEDELGQDEDIFYGLGERSRDGKWHTYTIDLAYELHQALPDTAIVALQGFYISGRGQIDDVKTLKAIPADIDSNGNGIPDVAELKAGKNPYH